MLKNILQIGLGGILSSALNLLALPLISRLFPPEVYAAWVLVIAIGLLVGAVGCLRYELAIVLPKDREDASAIFWLCTGLAAASSLLVLGVFSLGPVQEAVLGGVAGARSLVWALPVVVFAQSMTMALQSWSVRRKAFVLLAVAHLCGVAAINGVQVLYGWLVAPDSLGLMLGTVFGLSAWAGVLALGGIRGRPSLSWDVLARIPALAKHHRRFPVFSAPYALFGALRDRGVVLVVESYVAATWVGLYGFAYRLLYFPVTTVSAAIRPVAFRGAAMDGMPRMEPKVRAILSALVHLGLPLVVLFLGYSREAFALVAGERWVEAGDLGVVLVIPAYTFVLANWMDRLYDVLGLQHVTLTIEGVFSSFSLLSLWLVLAAGCPFPMALAAQGVVLIGENVVYVVLVHRRAGWDLAPLARIGAHGLGLAAVCAAFVLILRALAPGLAGMAAYLCLYALASGVVGARFLARIRGVSPARPGGDRPAA